MAWSSAGPWNENENVTSPSSPLCSTAASRWPSRHTLPSLPKRTTSPCDNFLAGLTSASQREPSSRLISVASIFGSVSRPMRRPRSWAAITLVSFNTSWSPGSRQSGRSATRRSRKTPSGCTISSRAESRGLAGRNAMLPAGSSKSKRSVRIAQCAPAWSKNVIPEAARSVAIRNLEIPGSCSACPGMTGLASGRVRGHMRLDDLVRVLHRLPAPYFCVVLPSRRHLAPHRVLVVEERRIVEADEELAVAGIRAGRARHRGGAADMRFLVELGLQLLAGTAGTGAVRAPGLRHEAFDHTVEHDAVVKSLAHQFLDPCDVARCQIGPHFDRDRPLRGFEDQSIFGVSHALFSTGWGGSFRLWKWMANGRPAMAPAIPSVNGIGVQRCNASMTAIRYISRSLSVASADS